MPSAREDVARQESGKEKPAAASNFLREIIEKDLQEGAYGGRVVTRFPPEPNGYLHIGHAKSIALNFGLARDYGGTCHLRFDDTNPETEEVEYVDSIVDAVRWLGYEWGDNLFFASDYFEQMYRYAVQLIRDGKAYVDSLNEEEIRQYRGTVTEPGRESPYRNRSVEENLDLFERMRKGEFPDGAHVLRARGDLASPNMKMRDPLLYRIKHAHHYRQGDDWCIYPFYDYAHPLEDAIENVTHSICTLEFDNNREIYDWVLDNTVGEPRPHQYEFARLTPEYTVVSKRKLLQLVREGHVAGWDDPRMPTLVGLRRRGVTPEAIRDFCEVRTGVTKTIARIDMALLEHSIRDDLNHRAPRVMAVLRPLKVTITNFPEGETEHLEASYWPHDVPKEGTRPVPFSRELYVERDDFEEHPPRGFHRLAPGREVRLRYGYIIRCDEVVKDASGEVVELRCTYDPETRSGAGAERKVKGTIHWVSAAHALPAEVRLYDRLFLVPDPDAGEVDFKTYLNPESLVVVQARVEPSVAADAADTRYQFERQGYFWRDPVDSKPEALVFNRIVSLRDSWARKSATPARGDGAKASVPGATPKPAPKPAPKPEASQPPAPARDPVEDLSPEARSRFSYLTDELGLSFDDALILAPDAALTAFLEGARAAHDNPQSLANWIVNELLREVKDTSLERLPFGPADLGRLVALLDDNTISSRIAKDVFAEMVAKGGDPARIVETRGLRQVSDPGALEPAVDRVLTAYPDKVEQYRGGKTGLIGFFTGQVMRETQGKANPELVQNLLRARLG